MKRKKFSFNKIWILLSKQYYLYFILAVVISVLMAQFAYENQDLDVTDVIELSTFSSVVLESLLRGITGFIRKLASNKVEDPSKLTTEYNDLVKTYKASKPQMIIGSENTVFPVVLGSWLYEKSIIVEDSPKLEYQLPEMVT